MNAKELMIGDWVSYKGNPTKIRTIEIYNVDVGPLQVTITYGDRICGLTVIDVSMLKPIPLTPEILEKNFGEKIDGEYFSGDEYYEIYIKEISDSIWKVDYDCVEMNGIPRQSNNVCFVHELQHALRLYGLFEQADCFSV